MATKHKLTYHKARQQWRKKKRIDGKDRYYYLGQSGVAKGDHAAYREALSEWDQINANLTDDGQQEADAERLSEATRQQSGAVHAIKELELHERAAAGEFSDDGEPGNPIHPHTADRIMGEARRLGVADLVADRVSAITAGGEAGSLTTLIEQFVAMHQRRHEVGDLSAGRFDTLRRDALHFGSWADANGITAEKIGAAAVEDYHGSIMGEVASGAISRAYARTRWVAFRMLIEWGWEREAWGLPRNLKARRFAINVPATKVATYPIDDLREVLDAAADRTQLYLLLMVNCGMYQSDISDLRPDEVTLSRSPRITRKRSKTADQENTPEVGYPLWPETAKLLKAHRCDDADRWLVNDAGEPLRADIIDDDGKLRRRDAIRSAVRRTYQKVNAQRKRDDRPKMPTHDLKLLRKLGADTITQNPKFGGRIADLYLGHSPRSMREKHYAGPEQAKLDEAVAWLGQSLDIGQ
jgi:integrase